MNKTYYVDAERGDDSHTGTDPQSPWRSLARVSDEWFGPGDRILLASGQTFKGPVMLCDACRGEQGARIELSTTGEEPATIDAGRGTGIILDGAAFATVENLRIVGAGYKEGNNGVGVEVRTTQHAVIRNLEVTGFRISGIRTGGGIGTRLENIYAHDNGGAGISVIGGRPGMPRSRDVYIGFCRAERNPGDPHNSSTRSGNGILIGGVDGALVEGCVAAANGGDASTDGHGSAGIWTWNSERIVIQNCISYRNMSSGGSGGGFNVDGGVRDSVIQYCLSYENDGCGFLLGQLPGVRPWQNNIIRFNVSVDDGRRIHQAGIALWAGAPGFRDGKIYNNTVFNRKNGVNFINEVEEFTFQNNIFYTDEPPICGDAFRVKFQGNYYKRRDPLGIDSRRMPTAKSMDEWRDDYGQEVHEGEALPMIDTLDLSYPRTDELPTQINDLNRLQTLGSPGVRGGVLLAESGGRDLVGAELPEFPIVGAVAPS